MKKKIVMPETRNNRSIASSKNAESYQEIAAALSHELSELQKAYEETRSARRAALNLMEDAILSKEALRINEERMRAQKEAFQAAINGAPLKDSLNIIAQIVSEETEGKARTAFYMADSDGKYLHPVWGAGNMPDAYLREVDGFIIGTDSLACGLAVPTGSPVLTTDVFEEPIWEPFLFLAEKYDYRGCWSFPVKTRDNKPIGTFAMYFPEPCKATAQDLALADIITQTAAVIITNYLETQERIRAEDALRKSEEQLKILNESLEQQVEDRTAELKESKEQLQKTANYVQRITQTVPDMISIMELKTRKFEFINLSIFEAEGFDTKWMTSKSAEERKEIVHPDDQLTLDEYFSGFTHLSDEETATVEYRAKNIHDEWLWFKVRGRVFLRDARGKATHILNVIQNITLQKQAAEKISELNKALTIKNRELETANTELKTFTGLVASDYKETLKHLYTQFEFIVVNDVRNLTNTGRANIRRAQSAIQKIKLLTDDIISYAHIQIDENDIATVDVTEIIDSVRQKLDNRIKETKATIKSDKLPVITGYPDLIQLLFYHLLNNAIKFRKEDTPPLIRIISSQINDSNVNHADVRQDMSYNMISVCDNGIGFEQKQAEKIFDMFSRLHEKNKYKGSGIGLAICKKIMNIHDGFITAESEPGKGSIFNCLFPLH